MAYDLQPMSEPHSLCSTLHTGLLRQCTCHPHVRLVFHSVIIIGGCNESVLAELLSSILSLLLLGAPNLHDRHAPSYYQRWVCNRLGLQPPGFARRKKHKQMCVRCVLNHAKPSSPAHWAAESRCIGLPLYDVHLSCVSVSAGSDILLSDLSV
jgi:hypothetical protein